MFLVWEKSRGFANLDGLPSNWSVARYVMLSDFLKDFI